MADVLKKIFRQLFAFFSSLQLAVFLLLSLAAVLAAGTVVESLHGTESAGHYVYRTVWFTALLGLLGLNVLCAALSRYPWKRHHTGFLVVHLGILIILGGSLLTLFKGFEGQLIIPEGESRERIFLKESSLFFYDQGSGRLEERAAPSRFNPPNEAHPYGGKILGDTLFKVVDFLPNAMAEEEVVDGADEVQPAIQVQLKGKRAELAEWFFARDYDRQSLDLGPARISFIEVPQSEDVDTLVRDKDLRGPVLWTGGRFIPLRGNLGTSFRIGGKTFTVENFLPHGGVYQGKLINQSDAMKNPVVSLTVRDGDVDRELWLFAKYPEMASNHEGVNPNQYPLRLLMIPEDLGKKDNELLVAKLDDGSARYRLKARGEWQKTSHLPIQEATPTGWMDFRFTVTKVYSRARTNFKFKRASVPKGKEGPPPALRIQIARDNGFADFWLGRGQARDVQVGDQNLKVAYALKSLPLGFSVKLKDFRMKTYQGTQDPSAYESQVVLKDPEEGGSREYLIAMNQPLAHRHFKIFQASYQRNPGGPDWSVLSVTYDPGIQIKYLGSIILVLGIVLIFYFRKAYMGAPLGERLRARFKGIPLESRS